MADTSSDVDIQQPHVEENFSQASTVHTSFEASPVINTAWDTEVEEFSLDPDFDYENVVLTPKYL